MLFALNCLLWGVHHSLPILAGLITRAIFDRLSGQAAAGFDVWTLLALLAATMTTRIGFMVGGIYAWSTMYFTAGSLMRRNILEWLIDGPGTRRLPAAAGEIVSRFRDDIDEVLEYLEGWTDFTGIVLFGVIAFGIMFSIDATIAACVFVPVAAIALFARGLGGRIRRYRKLHREATAKVTEFIGETFGAVQAVKVASRENEILQHFQELNESRRSVALKDRLMLELLRSVNANMANIGIGIVLLLGASAITRGEFTVGDFALFVVYLQRMTWTMFFMGDMLAQHRRTGVSVERLEALVVDAPDETLVAHNPIHIDGTLPDVPQVVRSEEHRLERIELRGLSYRHESTGRGIEGIDLEIRRGEFVVVTGRIGAGKSTLLRVMLGLLPRDSGEIVWNGVVVADAGTFMVPPRVAYTAQVPRLFSDTLRDNILMGQPEHALESALELSVLQPDVAHLESGLETTVGPRGVRLSGGQIQRSAAARTFARDPELLVFDDLSSALDVNTEATLWQRLAQRGDATCLVSSHRDAALQRADRILVLRDGRVEDEGTLEELLRRCEEMRALYVAAKGSAAVRGG